MYNEEILKSTDLFLLLNSQKIIIESRSGFKNLIKKYFKNKKEILKKIIK